MDLASIVTRIKAQCSAIHLVGGAAELDAAMEGVTTTPAAFVLPQSETAGADEGLDALYQIVSLEFGVVLCVRNVRDVAGNSSLTGLDPLRAAVRAALLGWTPTGAALPIEFGGGILYKLQPGELWWLDTYRTAYTLEAP